MPTIFTCGFAISLPTRFAPGDAIDATAAAVLNDIQRRRVTARLRYMLQKGDITEDALQAKALELYSQELVPYSTLDDDDNVSDPIMDEALAIARELIVTRMAQEGLPPPKNLDLHAKALVDGRPDLQEQARQRVEAKYRAAQMIIEGAK
jgi:hypothetical protein